MAQTAPQAGNRPTRAGGRVAAAAKAGASSGPGTQRNRAAARAAGRARPQTGRWQCQLQPGGRITQTPLNTNVVAEVALRLGLTARETPATVEVIDQQTMKDRGLRTTTDVAKAAVGVTGGDAPGAPAIFSMRGFTGDQINTLYNGIKIGPSTMTGRPMDTGNLEQVEILKGPASLLSGEGATGGAVNYVTKTPHTGPIVNEAFTRIRFIQGLSRRLRLRRQHAGQRAGLPLRYQPCQQQQLHRRHLFEAQQHLGPAQLSRHRQLQDLGRGRVQAGQGPVLLGHAAGAGECARNRADQRHRLGTVDATIIPDGSRSRRHARIRSPSTPGR